MSEVMQKCGWKLVATGKYKGLWRNYVPDAFYYTEREALTQQVLQNGKRTT